MFSDLPKHSFGAILADPPWRFATWDKAVAVKTRSGTMCSQSVHYNTMQIDDIAALPVNDLCVDDCALFLWCSWPMLLEGISIIEAWGFKYKSCAFVWMKAHANQIEMFRDEIDPQMGQGYWTRASSEPCLLATRGNPKRLNADVRQGIIAPRREHSRKPEGIHERIERLVAGPYLELFSRQKRDGWLAWGNETDKFREHDPNQFSWDSMWQKPFDKPELINE